MKIPVMLSKKKVIACVLSVMMLCGMSAFAYAEDGTAQAEKTAVTQEGVVDDDVQLMEENEAEASKDAELKEETSEQKVSEQVASTEKETAAEKNATKENEKEVVGKEDAQLLEDEDTVEVKFYGKVTLEGKTLEEGQFTIVSEDSIEPKVEIANDKDGYFYYSVKLPNDITERHYKITEKLSKTDDTIQVDPKSYDISVTTKDGIIVYDNTNKKNLTKNQDDRYGPIEFSNKVKTTNNSGNVQTEATKTTTYQFAPIVRLDNKNPAANRFTFTLKETTQGNSSLSGPLTAKNDANGKITFPAITYNKEGTYTYEISQDSTAINGIKKDTPLYKAEVTVTKNSDGSLKASLTKLMKGNTTITSPSDDKIVFDNTSTSTTTTTTNTTDANKGPTNTAKGPTTEDSSEIGLFAGLLVGFVIVLIGTLFSFRRRKSSRK